MAIPDHHVIITFGTGISSDAQGRAMLAMEKYLRDFTGGPVEVFKETMADDSKLRRAMSEDQRAKL